LCYKPCPMSKKYWDKSRKWDVRSQKAGDVRSENETQKTTYPQIWEWPMHQIDKNLVRFQKTRKKRRKGDVRSEKQIRRKVQLETAMLTCLRLQKRETLSDFRKTEGKKRGKWDVRSQKKQGCLNSHDKEISTYYQNILKTRRLLRPTTWSNFMNLEEKNENVINTETKVTVLSCKQRFGQVRGLIKSMAAGTKRPLVVEECEDRPTMLAVEIPDTFETAKVVRSQIGTCGGRRPISKKIFFFPHHSTEG